jgi:hypothetical protein
LRVFVGLGQEVDEVGDGGAFTSCEGGALAGPQGACFVVDAELVGAAADGELVNVDRGRFGAK